MVVPAKTRSTLQRLARSCASVSISSARFRMAVLAFRQRVNVAAYPT